MTASKKIYQEDSYLTSAEADVISCIKREDFYEVLLDKTIFYPYMSGGQPKDEGTINGINVFDVREKDDEIIHMVREPLEGTVKLAIDFNLRFDFMQQHTGQHILSYAFLELFGANTIGFRLGVGFTTIDLDISVTDDMIFQAEMLSNRIIYENRNITAKEYAYEDALKLNLRKAPLQLEFLRIVNIEGYEYNACSGTHVKSTGEVGIVKVIKSEKYKSGTRVEFLCGKRALTDYMMKNKITSVLSSKLSCGTEMISENFGKISDENKRLKKDIDKLRSELNEYKAKNFKSSAVSKNGIKYIFIKSEDDIKDLRFICSKISEEENYFSFFASESNSKCSMIIGQSGNLNIDIKTIFEKCKELINGKGGGSSFLMQCTGDIIKGSECIELAKEILIE